MADVVALSSEKSLLQACKCLRAFTDQQWTNPVQRFQKWALTSGAYEGDRGIAYSLGHYPRDERVNGKLNFLSRFISRAEGGLELWPSAVSDELLAHTMIWTGFIPTEPC